MEQENKNVNSSKELITPATVIGNLQKQNDEMADKLFKECGNGMTREEFDKVFKGR